MSILHSYIAVLLNTILLIKLFLNIRKQVAIYSLVAKFVFIKIENYIMEDLTIEPDTICL